MTSVIKTLGFTGTRKGMTKSQLEAVSMLLAEEAPDEVRHGQAVGADAQFHELAIAQGISIVLHPCTIQNQQASCPGAARVMDAYNPLVRNRHIVEAADVLIAAPAELKEQERGGTWSTWRLGCRNGLRVYLVLPDGTISVTE